jgi:Rieske [2Fe-2S] domain
MKNILPDSLVIGAYYLVPCIPAPEKTLDLWATIEDGWLPVFSQSHVDPETAAIKNADDDTEEDDDDIVEDADDNIDDEVNTNSLDELNTVAHYHIDIRFLKSELPIGGSIGIPASVFAFQPDSPLERIDRVVEWKRKKCYRLPIDDFENSVVPGMYAEGAIAKGLKLTDENVCPHQKTCLKGVPKLNNEVVCPAHGLKWNTLSGDLIPREFVSNIPYAMAVSKAHQDLCDYIDYDYARICDEKNIEFEVWNRLPMAVFPYFDRLVFEADREKYS